MTNDEPSNGAERWQPDGVRDGAGGGGANALGEVITTAVITAAVVPFVQTLLQKAAEDSYAAARAWLRRQFRSGADESEQQSRRLLVVRDPDPALDLALFFGPDVPDEAITALERLDVTGATQKPKRGKVAKTHIYWDAATGSWRVAHRRRRDE